MANHTYGGWPFRWHDEKPARFAARSELWSADLKSCWVKILPDREKLGAA
jgi:hypothetical protein